MAVRRNILFVVINQSLTHTHTTTPSHPHTHTPTHPHPHTHTHTQVKDQQEAEKRKVTSQEIQEQLKIQTVRVTAKREVVLGDLAKVEPAVKEAQSGEYSVELVYTRGGTRE